MLLSVLAVVLPSLASAQPAPATAPAEHGAATSAPLFVPDLPVGTVSVRVSRPSMAEPIQDVEVTGTWKTPEGKDGRASVKTGDDGRALFSAIPVGSSFQAKATVEGEDLSTVPFEIPAEGGARLLMIVGDDAQAAMAAMGGSSSSASARPRMVGMRAGTVEADKALAPGTLAVRILAADGTPLPRVVVDLAKSSPKGDGVELQQTTTDDSGTAHFRGLDSGPSIQYAAVVEQNGIRLGTQAFVLQADRGSSGEIRIPQRTDDVSVLGLARSSRMMLELREDSIAVLQNLILENDSDKVYEPGARGLFLPLASGFTGAEKLPGGAEFEIKEAEGIVYRTPVPPSQPPLDPPQIRVGYLMRTGGQTQVEIVQPMVLPLRGGLLMIPSDYPIQVSAPGLRARPSERDDLGNELRIYDLDAVPAGQALRLTVQDIPTHPGAGKWIAGGLAILLVLAGVVAARRPRQPRPPQGEAG